MTIFLLALAVIVIFLVLGFWVVKFLIWVAIVLAVIWVIMFFVRGIQTR
jgi:hypothetical protein